MTQMTYLSIRINDLEVSFLRASSVSSSRLVHQTSNLWFSGPLVRYLPRFLPFKAINRELGLFSTREESHLSDEGSGRFGILFFFFVFCFLILY